VEVPTVKMDSNSNGRKFMDTMQPSMMSISLAGNMLLQSRPVLLMECAGKSGDPARARAQLASAQSLGSAAELVLGAVAGQLSDSVGRKPFLSLFGMGPVISGLGVLLSGHSPALRLRIILMEACLMRCFFQSFLSMVSGPCISDVISRQAQPQARAVIQSLRAAGLVSGSLAGGWLMSKGGPVATYILGIIGGAVASINIMLRVPETLNATVDKKPQLASASTSGSPTKALRVMLSDPEALPLSILVGLEQLTHYPQFSDVGTFLFRDRLQWDPASIGRFVATYGTAQFAGNQCTGYLVKRFGPDAQASLSHLGLTVGFLLWANATKTSTMLATLLPLTLGFGRGSVAQSKAISRANELGLNNGEAAGVLSSLGSFAKILGPQIYVALYNFSKKRAAVSSSSQPRLPVALPMLFVAALGVLSEILHRLASRARRLRCVLEDSAEAAAK